VLSFTRPIGKLGSQLLTSQHFLITLISVVQQDHPSVDDILIC